MEDTQNTHAIIHYKFRAGENLLHPPEYNLDSVAVFCKLLHFPFKPKCLQTHCDYIGILQDFPTNVKCLLYSSFFFRSLINFWARMTFVEQLADDRVSLDLPQGGWVPTCHKPLYPLKEGCPMSVQGLSKSKTLSRSPKGHGWRYNLYLPLSFHWCFLCNRWPSQWPFHPVVIHHSVSKQRRDPLWRTLIQSSFAWLFLSCMEESLLGKTLCFGLFRVCCAYLRPIYRQCPAASSHEPPLRGRAFQSRGFHSGVESKQGSLNPPFCFSGSKFSFKAFFTA